MERRGGEAAEEQHDPAKKESRCGGILLMFE
jgi:hypothetical protein